MPAPKSGPPSAREEQRPADFNPSDYAILAQENIFHPDRKIPLPSKKEEKALPRPDIVLYGTYIASDSRLAFIEEKTSPVTSPGRGQRHTVIGIGEKVLGFELKQIEPNKIVLVRDKETIMVTLEAKKQRSGGSGPGVQPSYAAGRQPGGPPGQQFTTGQMGRDTSRPVAATPLPPPTVPVQQVPVPFKGGLFRSPPGRFSSPKS